MKKIVSLALFIVVTINCKAQSPVYNIGTNDSSQEDGVYNKDVDNILNLFEGTYLYTNTTTNTTLKFVLEKNIMQYNGKYYEDLMIGEYEYKVNNVTILSTLTNLNTIYTNQYFGHGISGNLIIDNQSRPPCADCAYNEKRLRLKFYDATTPRLNTDIIVRKIDVYESF